MNNKPLGVIDKPSSMLIYEYDTVCGSSNDTMDIPDYYMLPEDRIPDCRDQKKTEQCVAFAITNILQILNKIETGDDEPFSTTYVYGKHRVQGAETMKGMNPETALNGMTKIGSCKYKDLPELLENPEAYEHVLAHPELDAKAEPYKIAAYMMFNQGSRTARIEAIQNALLKYQYPILGIVQETSTSHAVAIIGWDNDKEILYVMNSWGDMGTRGIDTYKYTKLKRGYLMLDAKNTNLMPFEDVPEGHWGYKAIQHAYNSGIMNGTSETTFEPDRAPTRAELAAFGVNIMEKLDKILESMG